MRSPDGRARTREALLRYRRTRVLVPVVLAGYVVLAWADWWLPGRAHGEIFPFFSWDLFSSPREAGRLYTVRITGVRDAKAPAAELLDRPLVDPRAVPFLRDPRFQKTARSLARAHWHEKGEQREKLAIQLDNYLRPLGAIQYELLVLKYHPLRYYLGEEEAEVEIVTRLEPGS